MQLARSLPATRYDWRILPWLGAAVLVAFWIIEPATGIDATNFHALNLADPYRARWHEPGSFVYSPAFAQALYPFTLLPLAVFAKLLLAVNLASLAWLVGPMWSAVALALLPVQSELLTGQIHLPLAVMLVVGMRYPGAWGLVLLTKVTPGVGLVWFAVRREWRRLAVALGVTALIVAVSAVIAPHLWVQWLDLLRESPGKPANFILIDYPLIWRVGIAAVLTGLAAWRNRPTALPFIVLLSLPAVWFSALVLLAAIPRLAGSRAGLP